LQKVIKTILEIVLAKYLPEKAISVVDKKKVSLFAEFNKLAASFFLNLLKL